MLGMFSNKCVLRLESDSTAEWAARTFGEFERYEYPVSEAEQGGKKNDKHRQRMVICCTLTTYT